MPRLSKILIQFISILCLVVMVIGITGAIMRYNESIPSTLGLLIISLLTAVLLFTLWGRVHLLSSGHYRLLLFFMILTTIVAAAAVFFAVASKKIGWDPGAIMAFAEEHARGSFLGGQWGEQYLAKYNNNIFLMAIVIMVAKIALITGVSLVVLLTGINFVLLLLASFILMYAANGIFGRNGVVIVWILSLAMISLSPWVATFYTDTVGLFFVSLVTALMVFTVKWSGAKRYVTASLLGICAAIGILIKPTVAIIGLAAIVALLIAVMTRTKKLQKSHLYASIMAMLACSLTLAGINAVLSYKLPIDPKLAERVELSYDHFLAMGSLRGLEPYPSCKTGGYCEALVGDLVTLEELDTREERKSYHTKLLKDSVLTDFPTGYLEFVVFKVANTFGDGSFLVWREGRVFTEYIFQGSIVDDLRQLFAPDGDHISKMRYIWQGVWLSILFLIAIAVIDQFIRSSAKGRFWPLVFSVVIIGLCFYQIMFESRSRYIFLYLPVFILVASYGVQVLSERFIAIKPDPNKRKLSSSGL